MMTRITVLVENTAAGENLLAEHGLAFGIEHNGHGILFDTGQGYVLMHNAKQLGVSLGSAEAVALSHGHFDHTGGLAAVLALDSVPTVFAHPDAFGQRYTLPPDNPPREIGIPGLDETAVRERAELIWVEAPTEIFPGVHLTGIVPRITDFEDSGGPFFVDPEGRQPDLFHDDQALFLDTPQGTIVILGCAHAGIINTLMYIQHLTSGRPIHAVMGGMHLISANAERIARTIDALRELSVGLLMPAHCTGFFGMAHLWYAFQNRYIPCPAGAVFELLE